MSRFIAIDPASTISGWAVFQDEGLVTCGTIDARMVEYSFRPQCVINELIRLAHRYNFQEVVVEMAPRFKGTEPAALKVVVNSIKHWTRGLGLPFYQYNVSSWKKHVVGNYLATKEEVAANIYLRFPRLAQGLTQHVTDAIAIGVNHAGIRRLEGMAQNET